MEIMDVRNIFSFDTQTQHMIIIMFVYQRTNEANSNCH